MRFWIFMLLVGLLCPVIMIAAGISFLKAAPKKINSVYGYRTELSMKNQDTWEFAHKYCGKVWLRGGLILLPVAVIPMLLVIGKSTEIVGIVGSIIGTLGVVVLIASIFPTESALRKNFDERGNRKL